MFTKVRFFAFAFVLVALLTSMTPINQVAATPSTDPKDQQRVIVYFDSGSKGAVMRALQAAKGQVHYEFDDLNAIAVTLPTQAMQGIQRNPNVTGIETDVLRHPTAETIPYGIDMVQARDVWDADRDGVIDAGAPTGAGITVCVIDSGIYTGHEDFAGVNILGGYPTGWNNDTCGHGTHVAGTIAAAHNTKGVVGVSPGAVSFFFVQVFSGADCGWTYSSTLADAANRCAAAGAKVISMSLGGSQKSRLEETTFNNLYSQGILSIAAAGNAGTSALSYPASYNSVVSVAAIDENMAVADFSQYNSQVEVAAPGVGVLSTVPWISTNTLTVDGVDYQANHIDYAAYGTASGALVDGGLCTSTGSWSGRVVLCQRGDISFYDKVMNVQNSGGAAAVIYNNVPGNFLGTLDPETSNIVAISLSQADGQYLVANKLGQSATVVSTAPVPGSSYEAWDGTSMATPHVSGVAALVWSGAPTKTNAEIRAALTSTAFDLGAAGRDVYYGYGLVQACDALEALGGQCGGGGGTNQPPTANFTYTASELAVTFTDQSTDSDGTIVAWSWNFGDGNTATTQNPAHTYAAAGTYTVGLTVTDNDGATASTSKSVTVSSGGGEPTMYVFDITMTPKKVGTNRYAIAAVTIKDTAGNPVSGATVYGDWSGAVSRSVSGPTGTNGTVSFQSPTIKKSGTFIFTVTNVTKTGFTYDPGQNIETSDSILVP